MSKDKEFFMSPRIDFAFKLIFGQNNTVQILKSFLSGVLKIPKKDIKKIRILPSEQAKEHKQDKQSYLDILVQLGNEKLVNVEIQVWPQKGMKKRSLFYWSRMYGHHQLMKSQKYVKLLPCIVINVMATNCINGKRAHSKYVLKEEETNEPYEIPHLMELHFLELKKTNPEEKDLLTSWLKFLSSKTKEELKMASQVHKEIQEAYEILVRASQDDATRRAYEAREKELRDIYNANIEAREDGLEEGKQIGEEKGMRIGKEKKEKEVIQSMFENGISVNQIAMIVKKPMTYVEQIIEKNI